MVVKTSEVAVFLSPFFVTHRKKKCSFREDYRLETVAHIEFDAKKIHFGVATTKNSINISVENPVFLCSKVKKRTSEREAKKKRLSMRLNIMF